MRIYCNYLLISGTVLFLACNSHKETVPKTETTPSTLSDFLKAKNYLQIPLQKNNIGHFVIKGKVNGQEAIFILDTGASATCLDFESAKKFKLLLKDIAGSAAGYGGDSQKIQAGSACINLETFTTDTMEVAAIDLTSVNQAYASELKTRIDGVIGADILVSKAAVIDYETNTLFLKK